jgi:hypothetical protein
VGIPFLLKGSLDVESDAIRVQVRSDTFTYLDLPLQRAGGDPPISLDEVYVIQVDPGGNIPVAVGLRLSWNDGNTFVEVPLYLRKN